MKIYKNNIIKSYQLLQGNAKYTVKLYLLFAIPYSLFNFYFSLYMKSQGITDVQIGYLLTIGWIFSILASSFSGSIIDMVGRKRFSLIVEGIIWPLVLLLRLLAHDFWLFAIAAVVGSICIIGSISFTFMISEDATNEQRVSAFNLINILFLTSGILTPIAGLFVKCFGIATAERGLLAFGIVCFIIMAFTRNKFYVETSIGIKAREEFKTKNKRIKPNIDLAILKVFIKNPKISVAAFIYIAVNAFIMIGALSLSMYYIPYITEVLGMNKSLVSVLGSVMSVVLLITSTILVPMLIKNNIKTNIIAGSLAITISMFILILTPYNGFIWLIICNIVFAVGYGIIKPFTDTLLADAVQESDRASIYSALILISSVVNTFIGILSGFIYSEKPVFLFWVATLIIMSVLVIILAQRRSKKIPRCVN